MANEQTTAPATDKPKRKRASFTRTAKPMFAIVSYTGTDSAGQPVKLDKAGLTITLERDAAKLLEAVTSGGAGLGEAVLVKVDMPVTAKPAAAPTA